MTASAQLCQNPPCARRLLSLLGDVHRFAPSVASAKEAGHFAALGLPVAKYLLGSRWVKSESARRKAGMHVEVICSHKLM